MLAGCLQIRPEFGAPARNVDRIREMVRGCGADLLVLPELVTTGYLFADREEALSLSEPVPDGPSTRAMTRIARDEDLLICFGIAETHGGRLYNSAVLVGPEGVLLLYRKIHLFQDEWDLFEPGDLGFPVAVLPDGSATVGIMVCFDWIYPEGARCLALSGADLILHPSNLVLPYCQRAMVTRTLENRVFALTANRVGAEEREGRPALRFTGGSQVVSPTGEVLTRLDEEEEGLATCALEPVDARDKFATPRNSLLRDRRPDMYRSLIEGDRP